jgi:hypothetical protein
LGKYATVVNQLVGRDDTRGLWTVAERESRLPGPRANLEFLYDVCDHMLRADVTSWSDVLAGWLQTPIIDAPVNSAAEFPVACAAAGTACLLRADDTANGPLVQCLTEAAHSERWRTREALLIGMQRRGYDLGAVVLEILGDWATTRDPFLERAVVATLADPPLLKLPGMLELAFTTTEHALDRLQSLPAALRKTEGNRILEKALSFAISVYVAADPDRGFQRMERWLAQADRETRKLIIRSRWPNSEASCLSPMTGSAESGPPS